MRLRWRICDPQSDEHDLRQFACACGVQYGDRIARESNQAEVARACDSDCSREVRH